MPNPYATDAAKRKKMGDDLSNVGKGGKGKKKKKVLSPRERFKLFTKK